MRESFQSAGGVSRRAVLGGLALAPLAARTAPYSGARIPDRTGIVPVPGGRVWWRKLGDGPKPPLLVLHGGPGMGHDYLLPLSALAGERPILFYDQLGCGRSDKSSDPSLFTIARFAQRIEALRVALGLEHVALYGHSWGGVLALEYLAAGGHHGVEKLILSNTMASVHQANDGLYRLMADMPDGVRLYDLERAGDYDGSEYDSLVTAFQQLHFCRSRDAPPEFAASMRNVAQSPAARIMMGQGLAITGNLRGWDRRAMLRNVAMPTLVVTGEHDEITRDCHETLRDTIPNARLAVMRDCSHMLMTEAPKSYASLLANFLA